MVLAIGGIIAILVVFFMFGPQLLINFSLLVRKSSGNNDTNINTVSYIAPPVLDPMSDATKSATITISGYADDNQTIKLYVNGKMVDTTDVKKNKSFKFTDVKLESGSNEIKAKAETDDDKESNYSSIATISYIDKPPSLDISFPQDGQTISKGDSPITVRGKTDPGVRVTVNDFWAISNGDGSFSYSLALHDGDNQIKFMATDDAGNQTTKQITIKTN